MLSKTTATSPLSRSALNLSPLSIFVSGSSDLEVAHGPGRSMSDEMGDLVPGFDIDVAAQQHSENSLKRDSAERTLTSYEKMGTLSNQLGRAKTRRAVGPTGGRGVLGKHGVKAKRQSNVRKRQSTVHGHGHSPKSMMEEAYAAQKMGALQMESELEKSKRNGPDAVDEIIMGALDIKKPRLKVW